MRDLFKIFIAGVVLFFAPIVSAESFKLLILPDNIVTQNASIDSYIYDSAAELFADEIYALISQTDNIETKPVSMVRSLIMNDPSSVLLAKDLTYRFKTSYNIDYGAVKKLAKQTNTRYVLLITSTLDAENYILRRTWWDFFNIPGASVIDPAYKINTYAVLIDTLNDTNLWSDTYYKTISVVENRIITRGPSPQTEQLAKIRDYSRYLCPQIAHYVQLNILPFDVLAGESKIIDYDLGNIDNVFTKKYRYYRKESAKLFSKNKSKYKESKQKRAERRAEKQQAKLEVQAKQVTDESSENINKINTVVKEESCPVKNTIYNKSDDRNDQSLFDSIEIKKTRKNNLFGEYNSDKPHLRDYSR